MPAPVAPPPRRAAAAAPADGYTLIAGSMGTHAAAPTQYPNLKYDPAKDFTPIGLTAEAPAVLVTRKDFPANTLAEFIDYFAKIQAKVNEAHAGVGSQMHTYCTLLHRILGTKTARIAYRGGAPAINDLVAGQVDFGCVSINTAVSQIQGGTVKALAIASPERAESSRMSQPAWRRACPNSRSPAGMPIFVPGICRPTFRRN